MSNMPFVTQSSTQGNLGIIHTTGNSSRILFQDGSNNIVEFLVSNTFNKPTSPDPQVAVPAQFVAPNTPITAVASSDGKESHIIYVTPGGILGDHVNHGAAWVQGTLYKSGLQVATGTPLYIMSQEVTQGMQLAVCFVANGAGKTLNVASYSGGWSNNTLLRSS